MEVDVDKEPTPAVLSLLNEQAEQSAKNKTRLDRGLEDTFPASDPVAITHTATATGSSAVEVEQQKSELLGLHPSAEPYASRDDRAAELRAIRRDLENLQDRFRAVTYPTDATRDRGSVIARRIEQMISEHPLTAIGFVTALSFIMGAGYGTRRRVY